MKNKMRRGLICFAAAVSLVCAPVWAAELIPMGQAVGIRLRTGGVVVAEVGTVETVSGRRQPAAESGIEPGDVIASVDGRTVETNENLQQYVAQSRGSPMVFSVRRNGTEKQISVRAVKDQSGIYRIGMLIRDSMAGIGTLTYYDPQTGEYGALGHGICDTGSGALLPLGAGDLVPAEIEQVERGEAGDPGALLGSFRAAENLGTVEQNTICGIFGQLQDGDSLTDSRPVEIVSASELHTGPCTILSSVTGKTESYAAEIIRVFEEGGEFDRCVMLRITDPALLSCTGGIVQGMSGSPILQDGRLAGAVTHVLVNDPTRGYGISIESMLEAAG